MEESNHSDQDEVKKLSRWPGVIFSLLVPGFGLFRARQTRRGFAWLIGLQFVSLLLAVLMVNECIPVAVGVLAFTGAVSVHIWMLSDSFRPGRMTLRLWGLFIVLAAFIYTVPTLGHLAGRAFKIPTGAMEPTLMGSRNAPVADHILADRLCYLLGKPKRGDLVVFKTAAIKAIPHQSPDGEEIFYIKRLLGMPGERIEIRDGKVFANGAALGESDGIPPIHYVTMAGIPTSAKKEGDAFVVGEAEYFVMGDNSPNSMDSRIWGCVPEASLYGKITKIYFPFDRIGKPHFTPSVDH